VRHMPTVRRGLTRRSIAFSLAALFLVAGSGSTLAAAPAPPAIQLNSVTPFLAGGTCHFTLNFTVTGLSGKPSALWGVSAITPTLLAPTGGTATVATVTKADNGLAQEGIPNVLHANDGAATGAWYVFLQNPKGAVVALSSGVASTSSC
jgi:hypothetical protein